MSDNHVALKRLSVITSGVSVVLAVVLPAIKVPAGVGVLIGLAVAAIMLAVAWLKPNAVQDWLEQSLHFGTGEKLFDGPVSQALALEAMAGGGVIHA